MYIGCHVSIRNGYDQAAKTAHALGANAFQYFPKNPRSISIKDFDKKTASLCKQFCQLNELVSVAHTPYPTKLISENRDLEKQIISSLLNDLEIAEACGSLGVVVHFGSMKSGDPLEGYKKMISLLNSVLHKWSGNALILIENNAGAGTNMGTTLEEMVQIRKLTDAPEKIGFCFDTCHSFASGLWDGDNWDSLVEKGLELGYFQHLKVIHLNNSKYASGKRKDRHANLLNGYITKTQLEQFIHSSVVNNVPLILETPIDEAKHSHKDEIQLVKQWLN
ncbi:endonuclease IV [Anaerobacillus arseniciselenatis]|uniref:Endonuclease IV n=1 Tax=Anaerobacillus arseniciselenatis TaxID=85682 RepID=A0A1S2LSZ7_9BACI|nr:deoxyribonuclease IV [Anaerobacillus arseniciselenatis]OIJ15638.1 endonuclease IV [Anaerobacillus arseniciselenatis]